MNLETENINKILVREVNWIGDVIFSLPALYALRQGFPKAKIAVLANGKAAGVLRGNPLIDEIYTLGPKTGKLSVKYYLRSIYRIRTEKFDLAILLPNSHRAALDVFMCGIPRRIGFPTDSRGWLLTHKIPLDEETARAHRVQYFLRIVQEVGADVQKPQLDLPLPDDAIDKAVKFFTDKSLDQLPGVIAIHPGCSKFERSWHAERFSELAKELTRQLEVGIVLVGSGDEALMLKNIAQQVGDDGQVDIFTTFEPLELAAVIARSDLYIGNDSGVMHLAEGVHTKLVGIFGPSAPWETGPFATESEYRLVQKDFPCRPCRERFFEDCQPSTAGKPPCLEEITVADVMKSVEELWPEGFKK